MRRNILVHERSPFLRAENHRMDVATWLRGLGLEKYEPSFHDNDIDGEVLLELTADDLIGLGVTSIGHRRKLLAAIVTLKSGPASTLAIDASDEASPATV